MGIRHRTQYIRRTRTPVRTRPMRADLSSSNARSTRPRPSASSRRNVRARAGVGLVVVERHGNNVVEPVQPQRADVRRAARLHVDGPVAFQAVRDGEEGPQVVRQRVARVPLEAVEVRRRAAGARIHLNLRHAELLLQVRRQLKAELVDEGAAF